MIPVQKFQEISSKTKQATTSLVEKLWDNKWIIIPSLILAYGLIQKKGSLKSLFKPKKAKSTRKEEQKVHSKARSNSSNDRKPPKSRAPAQNVKLAHHRNFKEEYLTVEDLSTSYASEKDTGVTRTPQIKNTNKKNIYMGYTSDAESVVPEEDSVKSAAKARHNKATSNPDDLFFTIYQQLN